MKEELFEKTSLQNLNLLVKNLSPKGPMPQA